MSHTAESSVAATGIRAPQAGFLHLLAELGTGRTAGDVQYTSGSAALSAPTGTAGARSAPAGFGTPHPHSAGAAAPPLAPEASGSGESPARVHHWQLLELAAEGTWSRVYRALPADSYRGQQPSYAVKLLRPQYEHDPRAIALLRREVQVARSVTHRHLVAVVGAELHRQPLLVVMPWLDGATLRERLERGQQFDLPEVLWIARQTAEALGALHQSGWMHGDVKPSNIMVAPNGHVTLLDLGFARPIEQSGSIADRWILGTCNYLAPEWFTSALAADIRSDLYSLGVILFELLTGRLPYQGRTIGELAALHRREAPPPLRKLAPLVPTEVAQLVHAMIAKDPLRRPQTPAEVVERLIRLEIELFTARAWT